MAENTLNRCFFYGTPGDFPTNLIDHVLLYYSFTLNFYVIVLELCHQHFQHR
jgi:hypothetical protein